MTKTEPESASGAPASGALRRSAARLAAVQALYQIELTGGEPEPIIAEFIEHRLGQEIEGARYAKADRRWFTDVVTGASDRRSELDSLISPTLSGDWSLDRLGALLKAILRAATYELLAQPGVPARVAINEYVDIARAFFEGGELGFVNAALDRLARELRPGALEGGLCGGKKASG